MTMLKISMKMRKRTITWRKCWTASGREAVGGAANNVAAIFRSIHESWKVAFLGIWSSLVGSCEVKGWYTSYFLVIGSHMITETFKREDPGPPFYQKQYLNNVVIFAFFPAWSPPAHSTLINKLLNINTTETQHILITHLHCKQHDFWICSSSLEFYLLKRQTHNNQRDSYKSYG